jgi:catechol 2,3-dioxygenase-like lactoylglutathione lyase family enzyme
MLHHVELWVQDLARAEATFGWLFTELGWTEYQRWNAGVSWKLDRTYVVVEQSPALTGPHDRMKAGLNHLALHAGTRENVDRLTEAARHHGWRLMFADKHPFAGGEDHYAAFLENDDGFEVELVAG